MARPKTKSDPIHFRLSPEAYDELLVRAAEKGEKPSEWVVRVLERALLGKGAH